MIWFSNDEDGLVTSDGGIARFDDLEALRSYAAGLGIAIEDQEPTSYNLDFLVRWLNHPRKKIDVKAFLNIWNLFMDVSASVGGSFNADSERTEHIYAKLFWGNNLPSVTPRGKRYTPVWRAHEVRLIRRTLGHGLELMRQSLRAP